MDSIKPNNNIIIEKKMIIKKEKDIIKNLRKVELKIKARSK